MDMEGASPKTSTQFSLPWPFGSPGDQWLSDNFLPDFHLNVPSVCLSVSPIQILGCDTIHRVNYKYRTRLDARKSLKYSAISPLSILLHSRIQSGLSQCSRSAPLPPQMSSFPSPAKPHCGQVAWRCPLPNKKRVSIRSQTQTDLVNDISHIIQNFAN